MSYFICFQLKQFFPVMFNCWWIWIYILILFQIMNHRYFIVKSCNRENLELSVQQGVWATQRSNEAKLNEAFDSAENVILIFSVNRTRHFQVVWSLIKKNSLQSRFFYFTPEVFNIERTVDLLGLCEDDLKNWWVCGWGKLEIRTWNCTLWEEFLS